MLIFIYVSIIHPRSPCQKTSSTYIQFSTLFGLTEGWDFASCDYVWLMSLWEEMMRYLTAGLRPFNALFLCFSNSGETSSSRRHSSKVKKLHQPRCPYGAKHPAKPREPYKQEWERKHFGVSYWDLGVVFFSAYPD